MVVPSRHEPGGGGPLPVLPAGGGQYAVSEAALEESWRHPAPASYEPPSISPDAAKSRAAPTTMTWQGQQPASRLPPSQTPTEPLLPSSAQPGAMMAAESVGEVGDGGPSSLAAAYATSPRSEALSGARTFEGLPTTEMIRILNVRLKPGHESSAVESLPMYEEVGRR